MADSVDDPALTPAIPELVTRIWQRDPSVFQRPGWSVEERSVLPEELAQASEVFLSGTAAEIVPVGSVDGHHYQAGPVARS